MKYNYVKASKVYEKMFNLCVDPWELDDREKQEERRRFMYALTRKNKEFLQPYLEYIIECRICVCEPYPNAKSRCWDFDKMREYNALIEEIENFEN